MKPRPTIYLQLTQKLRRYQRRKVIFLFCTACFQTFIVSIPALLLLSGAQWIVKGNLYVIALSSAFYLTLFLTAARFFRRPIKEMLKPGHSAVLEAAASVGAALKGINDRLVNALQLYEQFERDRERYSPALIEAALVKTAEDVCDVDFTKHLDASPVKASFVRAVGIFAVACVVTAAVRPMAQNIGLLLQPWKATARQAVSLFVRPGDAAVIRGKPLLLTAWASDNSLSRIALTLKMKGRTDRFELDKATDDSFRHAIPAVRDSLVYYVSAGANRSSIYHIAVIDRPMLKNLKVEVKPPAYAKLSPYFLEDNIGDVTALRGSIIELSAVASVTPAFGAICFSDSGRLPLTIKGRKMNTALRLDKDLDYWFHFADEFGNTNEAPLKYRLRLLPDLAPLVQILSPAKDIDLGDDMTIPLLFEAQDDYGISRLRLGYQVVSGEGDVDSTAFSYYSIDDFTKSSTVRMNLAWNVDNLDMFPTDVLYYFVEAFDNDAIGGPKRGRSQLRRARFPSLYEMYQEIAGEQEGAVDAFEDALQKTRELRQKAEQLSMQLKREEDLNWQKKNELENVLQKQEEIREQIAETARQLEDMVEQVRRQSLFSAETMKKFEEIRQLYEQILTPELEKALEKMREALEKLDQDTVNRAMEELLQNFEEYDKALDRTIALLKQLKTQQQIEQAQKIAQNLSEREEKISQDAVKPQDTRRLQKEQEQINADAAELEKMLKELDNELGMAPSPLKDALEQLSSPQLQNNLRQLADNFSSGKTDGAPQTASEAAESFQNIAGSLEKMGALMSGELQRRALEAMRKSSRDLLALSQRQEDLMQQSRQLARNSAAFPKTAEEQEELRSALQRVAEEAAQMMKENFGIQNQVASSMGKAMRQMDQALDQLEARDQRQAAQHQQEALAALNEAVRRLQTSMQAMMQRGGSGGMSYQQFLQQMQQLGESQQRINQQTEQLSANPSFLGMQAAMSRLAAEQQQVRKSMESLAREAAGMREILGSLDKITEDMKRVEDDLLSRQITRDTIQRQNRILSRMLDAQRSVNQREFSRERQAETAKAFTPENPGELPLDLGEHTDELRKNLLRARQEGFSRDYLQIIEQYLKILIRNESEKK